MVLFAVGHEIRQFVPNAKKFEYSDIIFAERRIQAIDMDPTRRIVYWTDSSLKTIKRAAIPSDKDHLGFSQDLSVQGIEQPDGLAFDWVAK